MFPDDIYRKAIDVATAIGPDVDPTPIAIALLAERNANETEVETWRDKWRVASFSADADNAVAEFTRKWAKEIIGINATFVDDDLRVLCHLADLAVKAGLTKGLNKECQAAIAELQRKRRGEE